MGRGEWRWEAVDGTHEGGRRWGADGMSEQMGRWDRGGCFLDAWG